MPRLATRKNTTRKSRVSRKAAPKTNLIAVQHTQPYAQRIKGFLSNVESLAKKRQNQKKNDAVAKKLNNAMSMINKDMKKKNFITPHLMQSLQKVGTSVKGVSNVPATVRTNLQGILRFIRDHVRKDALQFIQLMNRHIAKIVLDVKKWERTLNAQLRTAKNSKQVAFKIDPSVKREISSLASEIKRFRTKWLKRLNKLAANGNPSIKSKIKVLKDQINELHKVVGRCGTLVNQCCKYKQSKTRKNVRNLIAKADIAKLHSEWTTLENQLETTRTQVESFNEQLKAAKAF